MRKMNREKENQIYNFILDFMQKNNYSPSYKDIMEGCDIKSPSSVKIYINRMCDEGRLKAGKAPDILPRTIIPTGYSFDKAEWTKLSDGQPPLGKEVMCTVMENNCRDIKLLVRFADGWYLNNEKIEVTVVGWKEKPEPCS